MSASQNPLAPAGIPMEIDDDGEDTVSSGLRPPMPYAAPGRHLSPESESGWSQDSSLSSYESTRPHYSYERAHSHAHSRSRSPAGSEMEAHER
jgi:hypothetical protein